MIYVNARAYRSDRDLGYDRWCADYLSCGRGTHEAIIVVFADDVEKHEWISKHQVHVTTKWDAQP